MQHVKYMFKIIRLLTVYNINKQIVKKASVDIVVYLYIIAKRISTTIEFFYILDVPCGSRSRFSLMYEITFLFMINNSKSNDNN